MMPQNWQEVNSLISKLFQWISSGPQKTPPQQASTSESHTGFSPVWGTRPAVLLLGDLYFDRRTIGNVFDLVSKAALAQHVLHALNAIEFF